MHIHLQVPCRGCRVVKQPMNTIKVLHKKPYHDKQQNMSIQEMHKELSKFCWQRTIHDLPPAKVPAKLHKTLLHVSTLLAVLSDPSTPNSYAQASPLTHQFSTPFMLLKRSLVQEKSIQGSVWSWLLLVQLNQDLTDLTEIPTLRWPISCCKTKMTQVQWDSTDVQQCVKGTVYCSMHH